MNPKIIKKSALILLAIFIICSLLPLFPVLPGNRRVEASSISREDIYKGLGIALILFIIARIGRSQYFEQTAEKLSISEEIELLARIISAEARGEPFLGQIAVGAVVLNRVNHPDFPNTIKDVIYEKGQFTPLRDGSFYRIKPNEEAYRAAREALAGNDPTKGALYFYNPHTASSRGLHWFREHTTIVYTIENHVFAR